jgi:hypothetical protein
VRRNSKREEKSYLSVRDIVRERKRERERERERESVCVCMKE